MELRSRSSYPLWFEQAKSLGHHGKTVFLFRNCFEAPLLIHQLRQSSNPNTTLTNTQVEPAPMTCNSGPHQIPSLNQSSHLAINFVNLAIHFSPSFVVAPQVVPRSNPLEPSGSARPLPVCVYVYGICVLYVCTLGACSELECLFFSLFLPRTE